jgi:hypothetical protein
MNNFTVNENSRSHKYLHKFSSKYRSAVYDAKVHDHYSRLPKDFCSFWRQIVKVATIQFVAFVGVLLELKFMYFALYHNSYLADNSKAIWYDKLEVIVGLLGLLVVAAAAFLVTGYFLCQGIGWLFSNIFDVTGIVGYFADRAEAKRQKRIDKYAAELANPKPDGLLKTWYKAYKEKHCPMAEFKFEGVEKGRPWWYDEDGSDQSEVDDHHDHGCDCGHDEEDHDADHADESEIETPTPDPTATPNEHHE